MTGYHTPVAAALHPRLFPAPVTPTGKDEWYTPPSIIEAARQLMGSIDVDPASCAVANRIVRANIFHTAADDGLHQPWFGNVWCNPPYSAAMTRAFHTKLGIELDAGRTSKACFLFGLSYSMHTIDIWGTADAIVAIAPDQAREWWGPDTAGASRQRSTEWPMRFTPLAVAVFGCTIPETRDAFTDLGVVR